MSDDHLNTVCKPGSGVVTCSFLMMGGGGWRCAKLSDGFASMIQQKRAAGDMRAMGDNYPRDPDPTTVPPISAMKVNHSELTN